MESGELLDLSYKRESGCLMADELLLPLKMGNQTGMGVFNFSRAPTYSAQINTIAYESGQRQCPNTSHSICPSTHLWHKCVSGGKVLAKWLSCSQLPSEAIPQNRQPAVGHVSGCAREQQQWMNNRVPCPMRCSCMVVEAWAWF